MMKETKKKNVGFLEKEVKILSHVNEIGIALSEIYVKSPKNKPKLKSFEYVNHSNIIFKLDGKTIKLRRYNITGKGNNSEYELIIKTKANNKKTGLKERIEQQTKITKEIFCGVHEFIRIAFPKNYHTYNMRKLRYSFDKFVVDICKVESTAKEKIPTYVEIELKDNKNDITNVKKFIKKLCPDIDVSKIVFSTRGISNLK